MAIAFVEATADAGKSVPFQIFATDVSEDALEKARAGTFIENIAADVSPDRLRRFFVRNGKNYQVSAAIRDACIFARQNVTRDPPFSRIDLISCRNVLIYFETALQRRVIPIFHYALRPTGFLVLGASETAASLGDYFTLVDKKHKIFAKNVAPTRPVLDLGPEGARQRPRSLLGKDLAAGGALRPFDAEAEADRVVLNRYAPPGVVVNGDLEIVQFRGHTGRYLEPAPGEASLDVLKMARPGLGLELRGALHRARRTNAPVRVERVPLRVGAETNEVTIEVIPMNGAPRPDEPGAAERWYLVLFEEERAPAKKRASRRTAEKRGKDVDARVVEALERDLEATREYLRLTIEEHESTSEELQSANEELLSSNEELQSVNEELETAKEELSASNEALTTLNEQLESKNAELARVNADLLSLLASVDIPIVMVGVDHRIRRFTPQAERLLNLIATDVGRPIGDIRPKIDVPDLERLIAEVVRTGVTHKRDVQHPERGACSLRVRPYRAGDGKIDGAVILFVDVDRDAASGGAHRRPPDGPPT